MNCHRLSIAQIHEALARFEHRVASALDAAPPSKAWVAAAVRRHGDGRCPVWIKRLSLDIILRHGDDLAELFCRYPDDAVRVVPYEFSIGYQSMDRRPRIDAVEVLMRGAEWEDEWGTRWGHAEGGVGATPIGYPLEGWWQLDEYLASRMPDPRAPGRFDSASRALARYGGRRYCMGTIHLALFERLHALRGMHNVFTDFYTDEGPVRRLVASITQYVLELIRQWGQLGADAVFLTDDWGSQTALMISPAMWRRFFKAHYAEMFAEVHRLGMDVVFHSCGNVMEIVEDLLEIGLDVLDPLQPGAVDHKALARRFGGRVSFCGGIDLQQLLSRGTPEEVRDEVRRLIDLFGRPYGGSLIVSPANVLTPDISLANLSAMFEAAHGQ